MKLETWAYVDGLDEAIVFYQNVFGAKIKEDGTWKNEDGTYQICAFELGAETSFSLAERKGVDAIEGIVNTGNIMQLVMLYKPEDVAKLEKAYTLLKVGAEIRMELQALEFTSHSCDLIDKYGVRWCLMVWE
jgi:PhnB protein